MYAVQVRLMKGHGTGVTTEKSMRNGFFFFYIYYIYVFPFFFFAIRSPNFSSFLFPFPLLFFSSFLCIFTARLFWSRSFGLGGVALSRQCGKTIWRRKFYDFFASKGFYNASYTCWSADIHITYSLCTDVFKYLTPLDMLRYTSVWGPFKKCLPAILHEYVIAVERI